MKSLLVLGMLLVSVTGYSDDGHTHQPNQPSHSARHGFILLGQNEIFASHLVFKSPHNHNVILKLNLNVATKSLYAQTRTAAGQDSLVFLSQRLDLNDLKNKIPLTGEIYGQDSEENEKLLLNQFRIDSSEYELLYFDEIP